MNDIALIALYVILYIIAMRNIRYAVFLYVLFLNILPLTNIQFLGLFGANIPFNIILFIHFISKGYAKSLFSTRNKDLSGIIAFVIIYYSCVSLMDYNETVLLQDYLDSNVTLLRTINRIVTFLITLLNTIFIIKEFLKNKENHKYIYNPLIISGVILVFSQLLHNELNLLGINVQEIDYTLSVYEQRRFAGIYGGGDTNGLGVYLNTLISIIFLNSIFNNKKLNLLSFLLIMIFIMGIFITASRMALITLAFIYFIYTFKLNLDFYNPGTKFINLFFLIMVLIVLSFLISLNSQFEFGIERITRLGLIDEISKDGHRYIRWLSFIDFSLDNISRFLFGSSDIFFVWANDKWRDPHNFFVKMLFFTGFVSVIIFIYGLFRAYQAIIKLKSIKYFIPFIVISLISFMIISQTGFMESMLLYVGVIIYYSYPKYNQFESIK